MTKSKRVIIYTAPDCAGSSKLRAFLSGRGVDFFEIDISSSPSAAAEMAKMSGQHSTPVADIDGHVVAGYDEKAIDVFLGTEKAAEGLCEVCGVRLGEFNHTPGSSRCDRCYTSRYHSELEQKGRVSVYPKKSSISPEPSAVSGRRLFFAVFIAVPVMALVICILLSPGLLDARRLMDAWWLVAAVAVGVLPAAGAMEMAFGKDIEKFRYRIAWTRLGFYGMWTAWPAWVLFFTCLALFMKRLLPASLPVQIGLAVIVIVASRLLILFFRNSLYKLTVRTSK